ncbi:hypothetical protein GCM10010300_74130 [Streptomyces olivaceoviridis]|nr:hypothetical protein GCM10010300_74130 [Streptomyces olivaceoviridis]
MPDHGGRPCIPLKVTGSPYLGLIAPVPPAAFAGLGGANQLTGTSILIIVSVGLEAVKRINSRIEQHSYEGFLR